MKTYQIVRWHFWLVVVIAFFFGALLAGIGKYGASDDNAPGYVPVESVSKLLSIYSEGFLLCAESMRNAQNIFSDLSRGDYTNLRVYLSKEAEINDRLTSARIRAEKSYEDLVHSVKKVTREGES